MSSFLEPPTLNSSYEYRSRLWESDKEGQPAEKRLEHRRRTGFVSQIPKAKKVKTKVQQRELDIVGEDVVSDAKQKYDQAMVNGLHGRVDAWRELENPNVQSATLSFGYASPGGAA